MIAKELIEKLSKLHPDAEVQIRVFPPDYSEESIWFEVADVVQWPDDETFALLEGGKPTNF